MQTRTILITGASRGIGAAIARRLAADGHRIALGARSVDALEAVAAECGGLGVHLDVTDPPSVTHAVAEIEAQLGPVDVLVNNAGIALSMPFGKTSEEDWARTLAVNLTGAYRVTRAVLPGMIDRRWGRLIFMASTAGLTGMAYTAAYCASKHGMVGLSRALAVELARTGVTSNAVCPGFVETDMAAESIQRIVKTTGRTEAEARRALERISPQHRMMQVDEVVHAVRMLLPDSARGINGTALAIDGGQVLH